MTEKRPTSLIDLQNVLEGGLLEVSNRIKAMEDLMFNAAEADIEIMEKDSFYGISYLLRDTREKLDETRGKTSDMCAELRKINDEKKEGTQA